MSIKLKLQNLSEWVNDSAKAAKGAVELTLESGLLKDSLDDLCELGGVTGALFKLGSRAIPDPTPEQRIAARLHKRFLTAFDHELREYPDVITEEIWRSYRKERLPQVAVEKLSTEFTWFSIFGSRGPKPGRSWPIVGELADLGRTWIAEMAATTGTPDAAAQKHADGVRGRIHEALTREVDQLVTDTAILQAFTEAQPKTTREALNLLAQELTTLQRYRLFGEIPQDTVYIPARVKIFNPHDTEAESDWRKIPTQQDGDQILLSSLRKWHPRLLVIEGDMGVGKSCLLRLLASRLAEAFLSDRLYSPVYVRWRDVYNEPDLAQAIADEVSNQHDRPLHDLPNQEDIIYLIDGFDEMSSHQEEYVVRCFERLARLVQRKCSVVVAMRSTAMTPGLQSELKTRKAVAVQVQDFEETDIDIWAQKWRAHTERESITGERLRTLGGDKVADNPLLLYMLAKYVEPAVQGKTHLRRTEVFRIFVDETIKGKLRTSQEDFPLHVPEQDYRFLLQELAYLASWPKHSSKCPVRLARKRIPEQLLSDMSFKDIRTAFVLHFFEATNSSSNEFEFQPEIFRQYLLAEWCVRTQFDALRNERSPAHPLARTRDQAMDALAQFPLREEERNLLNEIYEEIADLPQTTTEKLAKRLSAFGWEPVETPRSGSKLVQRLYERVRNEAQEPPQRNWEEEDVGIPAGEEVPPGLNQLRLAFNYWDQCLIATLGLYRGLKKKSAEPVFDKDPFILSRFLKAWHIARGFTWGVPLNLSELDLEDIQLQIAPLQDQTLDHSDLFFANLSSAHLIGTFLRNATLDRTDLQYSIMVRSNLEDATLYGANLSSANLMLACLTRASLVHSNLRWANLRGAELVGADLTGADLTEADLSGADLSGANLFGAQVTPEQLSQTIGCPERLPDGSVPTASSQNKTADPGNPDRPLI